jgi:hypothetical protein
MTAEDNLLQPLEIENGFKKRDGAFALLIEPAPSL